MNHLVYLRTFLDAYRAGSLTKAAHRLGITQPAASAHLATLEAVLGKPLFKRQPRGVAPTLAADDLARSIAAQLDGLEATMSAAQARSPHLAGTVDLIGPAEYLAARVAPLLAPLMIAGFGEPLASAYLASELMVRVAGSNRHSLRNRILKNSPLASHPAGRHGD